MTIRPLRFGDVLGTSRMYLSLSDDNRRLFHPFPFQQWIVVLILVLMFISQRTPNLIRRLVPKVVFLPLVAADTDVGALAGFGYLRLAKRLTDNKYAATLGLMVSDSYQQQGLGTQLMRSLIKLASQNNVGFLSLVVLRDNQKAIKLYQKCGFNMVRERVIQEHWNGRNYPACEMELSLPALVRQKTKSLNIGLVVFPLRNPDQECGQTFIGELTHVLSPVAEKVYVITGNLHLDNAASNVRVVNVKASVVKTHQELLLLKAFRFISAQVSVSLKLLQWHNKIDLVILFTLVGPLFLPTIIAKLVRKRTIVIASGSNAQILGRQYPSVAGWVFAKIIAFTEHINYMIADRLVVYSQEMVSSLGIERYSKKTITDGYRSYLDTTRFRVTQPIEARQPVVGYVGRLIGEKGVIELARAILLMIQEKNYLRFLIVGDGPLLEQMKEILAQGKCLAKAEFTGWVPAAEVPDYLNRMRLLILPSYTEGLPKCVLEAMACGTPVLVTPVGALPDVIKDKDTGFIMQDNTPNRITQSVVEALDYPYLDKVARNARALVENRFTFEAALERYRNVLDSLRG